MGRGGLEDIFMCLVGVWMKVELLRYFLRKSLDGRMGLFGGRGKAELSWMACEKAWVVRGSCSGGEGKAL